MFACDSVVSTLVGQYLSISLSLGAGVSVFSVGLSLFVPDDIVALVMVSVSVDDVS